MVSGKNIKVITTDEDEPVRKKLPTYTNPTIMAERLKQLNQ
jgi:hypothetical protein